MDRFEELKPFLLDKDGTPRTLGHAVVAWWVGNWLQAEQVFTHDHFKLLIEMIDSIKK